MVEQGTHKSVLRCAVLSRVGTTHNRVTYRLYRLLTQEHITPIERIPDPSRSSASYSSLHPIGQRHPSVLSTSSAGQVNETRISVDSDTLSV